MMSVDGEGRSSREKNLPGKGMLPPSVQIEKQKTRPVGRGGGWRALCDPLVGEDCAPQVRHGAAPLAVGEQDRNGYLPCFPRIPD